MSSNILNNFKIKWRKTEVIYKWEWILIAIICALLLPNFFYNDIIITTRHGINLWHCIADGFSVLDFYKYNSVSEHMQTYLHIPVQGCAYSFAVYLVFAIWNLPIFFLERFANVDVFANPAIVFYAKSILIVALIFSANIFKKICRALKWSEKKASWATYLYVTSSLVMSCIIIVGQYDIFSLCFTLLGVLGFLENDKIRFVFWFGIAFLFKPFAFIVFVPLVLLKEKKIMNIFKYIIFSFIPLFVLKLIFKSSNVSSSDNLESMLFSSWFSSSNLSFSNFNISFFVLFLVLLCVFCYIKKPDSNEIFLNYTIYISAAAYLCFFMFIPAYPYWYILMAPFIILLVFMNNKYFKTNLLLETIGMSSLFFLQQISGAYWCFSYRLFIPTFWNKIFDLNANVTPKFTHELLNSVGYRLGFTDFSYIVSLFLGSIFIASIIALLIINCPLVIKLTGNKDDDIVVERSIIYFRNFANLSLGLIPIIVFLFNVIHHK